MAPVKKIKILHIIPTLNRGGAERLLLDIARFYHQERFALTVLVFKEQGDLYDRFITTGVPVIVLTKKRKIDVRNFLEIYQKVKREKPDIVHTHLGGDIYGRLAAHLAGVPVIISTEQNVNRDENLLVTLAKRLTIRWANGLVALSEAVKKDASLRYHVNADRYTIIYSGIDCAEYDGLAQSVSHDYFCLGAAGRLVEQKGFIYLIEAMRYLVEKKYNVRCLIAGEGPLRNLLEEKIKAYHLENIISLLGLQANMAKFYHSLDVFVMPSVWEGLGLAVLEAGASGLPVIAARVDGLQEIITDGLDGWFFIPGDSNDLGKKIEYLINQPEIGRIAGKKLGEKVRRLFSIEKTVREYEALYEQLLKKYENSTR